MADTSQQQTISEPHTNGVMDGLTEDEKSKMRPADIDADMREMERRKRVEMMMNSRLFREELERIIETQMKDGAGPSGLLQQISDMMGAQGARFNGNVFKNSNCVLPINDIRGVESMGYAKGEKLLRCKLAAVFRLLDLYGWTQGVGGQITARLNQDQEHFLVNPYGLLYHEVTASSLIKVDMQGTIVEQGTTNFGVHVAGFQLHSTIHAARPDIKCIVHITTPSVTAISSLKCGLLPIGQESIVIGEVSSHQYIGGSIEPEEKEKIARNLGPMNKVMLLTNRGALCCGETVEEAFFNVYNMVLACETQLKLMPAGLDNLNLISEESKKAIFEASRKPPSPQQTPPAAESTALAEKLEKRWRIGGTEFEALMRMLDNAGFRTGYIYRNPLVKGEPPRPRNDVEVPPAVSSLGYLLEEEELYKQGLWKGGRKGTDRSRWLNSPNVYQKVEILETGTPDPKKITKWVSDGSPTHSSTPVKIDSALQFVPKNTNPKEFKQIQQQIKDYRRADKISAGPQSHILEGVTWEEAKKMQDATISGTGEQVVLVGAASKGIIQRGFQHNAMVYKTPYAKNPFDAVTDQELDQYKKEVERKQKGDPYDESQSESEALSSFNVSRATHESSTAKSPVQSPVSVTSETEEESRDEPRVLRIETKQVPAPSQPEVVLSDDRDTSGRYSDESESESESEYENENEHGVLIDREPCNCQIEHELYRHQPRLEITRSDVVAEKLVAMLIEYPSPPAIEVDCSLKKRIYVDDDEPLKQSCEKTRKSSIEETLSLTDNGSLSPRIENSGERGSETGTNPVWTADTSSIGRLTEMLNGIDCSVTSSRTRSNTLICSDLNVSTKYSLGPSDMSLIYSLTPFIGSEDHEDADGTRLEESSLLSVEGPEREEQCYRGEECTELKSDYYAWSKWRYDSERHDFSEETIIEIPNHDDYREIRSNEYSSGDTMFRLLETTGELFRNEISDSVNEIIAELDVNETYWTMSCLVKEILRQVCGTISTVRSTEQRDSPISTPEEKKKTQSNENARRISVIQEIVHHVIDFCDESHQGSPDALAYIGIDDPSKKAKNSANVELKESRGIYVTDSERDSVRLINDTSAAIANDENESSAVRTPEAIEADAIFEFRTIAKQKWTCMEGEAYELNFRVEKVDKVEYSVEPDPGESDSDDEKKIGYTVRNHKEGRNDFYDTSDTFTLSSISSSGSDTVSRVDWYINSNSLPKGDRRDTDVESSVDYRCYTKPCETDDNGQEYTWLTPIFEEENDEPSVRKSDRIEYTNAVDIERDDEEICTRDFEDVKSALVSKANDRTYIPTTTEVHANKDVTLASLEFA